MRGWVLSALERSGGADHVVFQELVKKTCAQGRGSQNLILRSFGRTFAGHVDIYVRTWGRKSILGAKNRMCKAQKPSTTTLLCPKWFWMLGKSFRQLKIIIIIIIRQGLVQPRLALSSLCSQG